jgi:YVTN family beta-propeller protein
MKRWSFIYSLIVFFLASFAVPSPAAARLAYVTGFVEEEAEEPEEVIISGTSGTTRSATTRSPTTVESGGYAEPVDLETGAVGNQIPFGTTTPAAVAITPDGKTAYVAETRLHGLVVPIDIATNTAEAPIEVGSTPIAIAITPDGTRAYVVNVGDETVTSIDLTTNTPVKTIPVGGVPVGIAIAPDGTRAYVTSIVGNSITPIDLATDTAGPEIPAGDEPIGIAIAPSGAHAYVTDLGSDSVARIDLPAGTIGATVPVPVSGPFAIAISPDGTRAYVIGGNDPIATIDLATDTAGPEIPAGGFLSNLALLPDGTRAFITNRDTESLDSVLPPATLSPTALPVGEEPEAIAIVPDQPPHATFSSSASSVSAGDSVSFDGKGSTDPDGSVARYDWDFGDGTQAPNAGSTAQHSYSQAGTYTVTLTTTDNEGCSASPIFTGQTAYCIGSSVARDTHTVTVLSKPTKATVPHHCVRAKGRGSTFVPEFRTSHVVPGVRVRLAVSRKARLKVSAMLLWSKGGGGQAKLGTRSAKVRHWRRVRFPIPVALRRKLPVGTHVRVKLKIEASPSRGVSCSTTVSHRTVEAKVVRVIPHAIQFGRSR